NWKLDSSTAITSYPPETAAYTSGSPMLPRAAERRPAAVSIAASMVTAVVLPLVPVSPNQGAAPRPRSRQAGSGSEYTGLPAAIAARTTGVCGAYPGETTRSSTSSQTDAGGSSPSTTVAPASRSRSIVAVADRSSIATRAPNDSSTSAQAAPATPA